MVDSSRVRIIIWVTSFPRTQSMYLLFCLMHRLLWFGESLLVDRGHLFLKLRYAHIFSQSQKFGKNVDFLGWSWVFHLGHSSIGESGYRVQALVLRTWDIDNFEVCILQLYRITFQIGVSCILRSLIKCLKACLSEQIINVCSLLAQGF